MFIINVTLLCQIATLNSVHYIHLSRDAPFSLGSIAAELMASCDIDLFLRTEECFDGPSIWAGQRPQAMLFATSPAFYQLEALQMTCYPNAGIWCLLGADISAESPELLQPCDVFVISDEVMLVERHVIKRTNGLTMFTLTRPATVCNKAGVPNSGGDEPFKSDFNGLNLLFIQVHVTNNSVYTGKLVPANEISPARHGMVKGFEEALLDDAAERLNFSLVHASMGTETTYGLKPEREQYWDGTVLRYVISRRAHLAFGDLSMLEPRQDYFDFDYPHDVDVATFLAKVDVKLYSGGQLLNLIGGPVISIYIVCAFVYSMWFTIDRVQLPVSSTTPVIFKWFQRAVIEFVNLFVYFSSYIARPNNSVRLNLKLGVSKFLIVIWRLSMFWMATVFSSTLISFITNPTVQGKCETLVDVVSVLKTVARSRIFTLPGFKWIFDSILAEKGNSGNDDAIIETLRRYMVTFPLEDEVVNAWRLSRVAFVFGESLSLRRYVWMHSMGDFTFQTYESTYNAYQSVGFQKGCILRTRMSYVLKRYVETGHLDHYKRFGGIHLGNYVHVPLIERSLGLSSLATIYLFVGIGYGLCIVVLLVEILEHYQFITPAPRQHAHYDFISLVELIKEQEGNKAQRIATNSGNRTQEPVATSQEIAKFPASSSKGDRDDATIRGGMTIACSNDL